MKAVCDFPASVRGVGDNQLQSLALPLRRELFCIIGRDGPGRLALTVPLLTGSWKVSDSRDTNGNRRSICVIRQPTPFEVQTT